MATWLYPIAKRSGREFWLDDGTRLKVSVDSYTKLVKNGRLGEDELWGVSTNFLTAQIGDEVFIYTGDQNLGIIGYATILKVDRKKDPAFHLDFDLKRCAALLDAPVPASLVRKWVWPRSAVTNLTPHLTKLNRLLPWKCRGKSKQSKPSPVIPTGGGGFGSFEQNKKVEQAAVRKVTAFYRKNGWNVKSVEQERCGFDLFCSKGSQIKRAEVKGISGDTVSFMMTAGERRASKGKDSVLHVVCKALSKKAEVKTWIGPQMQKAFSFVDVSYQASLKKC